MPKKVSLDELDIDEASLLEHKELSESGLEADTVSKKWRRNRLIIISASAFLLCLAGVSLWRFLVKNEMNQVETKPASQVVAKADAVNVASEPSNACENVNDLLVPLNKNKGRQKALVFDIAFEIEPEQSGHFRQNLRVIRSSIYKTVKMNADDFCLQKDARNILRQRIKKDIEALLGKGIVKDAFFTRFIVL